MTRFARLKQLAVANGNMLQFRDTPTDPRRADRMRLFDRLPRRSRDRINNATDPQQVWTDEVRKFANGLEA